MAILPATWRRWHRWFGFPAALFLLYVSVTGFIVAGTEFFGEEEALREATRDLVSPVRGDSPPGAWAEPLARAMAVVAKEAGSPPIDRVEMQFKGDHPTVTVYTGKPEGGEDRRFIVDARTGALVATESYVDKPFIKRLHSGEAFGDGGLVVAMGWALALAVLTVSGFAIFWRMRRRDAAGWRRYFF